MSRPIQYEPYEESVGGDPRERPGEVEEAPGKIWFRDLDEAVIEADRCVQCASCVAACPSNSIGIDEETRRPTLVRMCTGCSSCWDYCPRSGFRYERHIELVREERRREPTTYAARAVAEDAQRAGQDGGVVTTLLAELLEAGELDGALVAREDEAEPLRAEAFLATSREDLLSAAGSGYNQTMQLGHLEDAIEEADLEEPRLALVGTPCVIQGATALERYDHESADPIALTIALMCTRSFEHDRLVGAIADYGVDPESIAKLDVSGGVLYGYDAEGESVLEEPVDAFESAGLRGCEECTDFLGEAADVSVGSVGSDEGYTTVVVRSDRGERALERGGDALEAVEMDSVEALERLAAWNSGRARETLPRSFDPDGSIGITCAQHREAYEDTDRAPEPLNPARVHQYEEWC